MYGRLRVHGLIIAILAMAVIVAFLTTNASAANEYYDDVVLSGVYEDTTIEAWGNITVPQDATLELRNVTLVFHTNLGPRGLFGEAGCTIKIVDGDGNPDTVKDMSIITSSPDPWFISISNGRSFTVKCSRLEDVAVGYNRVKADTIVVDYSYIGLSDAALIMIGTDINITGSQLTSDMILFQKYLMFICERFSCLNSVTKDIRLRLTGTLSLSVERCFFSTSSVSLGEGLNATIKECTFDRTELSCTDSGAVRLMVEDCRFVGPIRGAIDSYSRDLYVQGCTFDNVDYAISVRGTDFTRVIDSQIVDSGYGIILYTGNVTISDCSIEDVDTAIYLNSLTGLANISSVKVTNCKEGIYVDQWNGPFTLIDCTLANISGTGLMIRSGSTLWVEGSAFINMPYGINCTNNKERGYGTMVKDSVFMCYAESLVVTGGNLSVVNVTIDGDPSFVPSIGISLTVSDVSDDFPAIIEGTSISNFSKGIVLVSDSFRSIDARVDGVVIEDCDVAMSASFLGTLRMVNVTVERFEEAINISHSGEVLIDNVLMANGTDGLTIWGCNRVQLEKLGMKNLAGMAIYQDSIDDAVWYLSREQILEDLRISVVGNVIVTVDLTMRWVDLEIRGTSHNDEGFDVSNGSWLLMDNSSIRGEPAIPSYIRFHRGTTLVARDSSFAHIGAHHEDPSKGGLSLEGGSHDLVRTTITDCRNGLILKDADVTLVGCTINRSRTGISSTNSEITLLDSHINASLISIDVVEGQLRAENVSFTATAWNIGLDTSEAWFRNCTLATGGALTRLVSSTLQLINVSVEPPWVPGGSVMNSDVDLFDTLHKGNWTLKGSQANVRVYWHLDLIAHQRWDDAPVMGAMVSIYDQLDPDTPFEVGTTGDDGALPRKWLLERMEDISQSMVHAPFRVVVEIPGVRGEVDVPADSPWEGIVELVDISPPDLDIQSPVPGTFLNATLVSFDGTVEEVGSGLQELEGSLDGGLWEPLDVTLGRWSIQLDAYDGIHNLSVRASDLDGNLVIAETWVVVDTVLPLVSFTDPAPSTPFPHKVVTLSGFIHLGEGTPIDRYHVDGSSVPLSPNGTFEIQVTLLEEGENVFVVEAWDAAGNRGEARLVLVRDTMSPVVHLDDFPALTRSTSLLVNGTIDDVTRVEVTLDGRYVPITDDGAFTIDVDLHQGRNRMLLEVVDAVGNRVSRDLDVACDYLINGTIVQPIQGAKVRGPYVQVEVATDPNTWVRVVDLTEWTLSHSNGSVVLNVELEPGEDQTLTVEFKDDANNLLVQEVDITVRKPLTEGSQEGLPLWPILFVVVLALVVIILAVRPR